jgi:ribA/ribD-fused uncharacterized protein
VRSPEERLDELLQRERTGTRVRFVFFWKEERAAGAGVGRECLNQFWPAPFVVDDQRYPDAEHWMMAEKARLFGDGNALRRVLAAKTPQAAKAAGRTVTGFSEGSWSEARYGIVVAGNLAKFSQNGDVREYLLSTRDHVLVEASPLDRVWGIGLAEDDSGAGRPSQWRGLNLLGFALMEVRDRLRG